METQAKVTTQILSAKTRKSKKGDGRVLDLVYNQIIERENGKSSARQITDNDKSDSLVHDDLLKSLKAFIPHLLLVTDNANVNEFQGDYFKKKKFLSEEYRFEVNGLHLKDKDGKLYAILVGRQLLKSGRGISFSAPMIHYNPTQEQIDSGNDVYPFHKELSKAIQAYVAECEKYTEGHFGKPAQQEIEYPEGEETKVRKIS